MVAGALLAGAGFVQVFPVLPPVAASVLLLLLGLWLYHFGDMRRALGAALVGIAWTSLFAAHQLSARLPSSLAGTDTIVEGRVLDLPRHEDDALRFDFFIESAPAGVPIRGRVRLGWYGGAPRELEPGSRWRLAVRLKPVTGTLNPGTRDSERQAFAQRILATGYVREPRSARVLAAGGGVDALRDRLSAAIGRALPDGRARFVQALAVGDTRGLGQRDWEVLRATGLTHQIAISGFHVGLVAGLGSLLASALYRLLPGLGRRLPRPQGSALAALLMACAYTALAGFALPTVRTLLMIAVLLLARLLRRPQRARDGFALALVGIVLFDPLSVLAPGFWLSFAGVGWLIWCLPRADGVSMARGFLRAQLVAMLALLPLTAWFFGQVSVPGPLANMLGVPLISLVVVPLALAGLLAQPVSPALAAWLWQLSATTMQALWQLLETMASWHAATVWLPEPSLLAVALACIGAAWCLLPRVAPGRALACLLFLPLLWPQRDLPEPGEVQVQVLDVGQGLAVLVSTARHRLLYDTGAGAMRGAELPESAAVSPLRALGVTRLDLVLISHGQPDHAGGLDAVLRAWPGTRVLGPEGWARPGMGLCEAGQHWHWDGVDFRVLHPPALFPYLRNDSSCVLRIEAGGHVALIPGDIGRPVEARLVGREAALLKADLVLVPQHGSRRSSSPEFIHAVAARWAVFSVGQGNRSGLPKADVVQAWRDAGAQTLTTTGSGFLEFRLGPAGAELRGARRIERPRYWREPAGTGSGYATGTATANR